MYNPNERVAGMLARASGNRSSHHGIPMDNVRTGAGMVARAISNRSSYHGNNTDNASVKRSRRHGEPIDNAGASASKPNAEYVGKDKYPISIFKLEERKSLHTVEKTSGWPFMRVVSRYKHKKYYGVGNRPGPSSRCNT